jgi:signal peptidase I
MSDLKENSVAQSTSLSKSKFKFIIEQVGQLFFALLIVFAIRSSIVEPFKIPSGSMIPTLFVGDFIFVNKFAYNFKLPFSDLFGKAVNLVDRDPPKRGDVIVFLYPKDTGVHYIKRVIGLPGDRIRVQDKVLFINDQKMEQVEVPADVKEKTLSDVGDPRYGGDHMRMFKENLGTKEHTLFTDGNNDYTAQFDEITVPPNHLFVMGDNRDFSNDSRFWGYVPFENIAGRAEVIWLSLWVNFENPSSSTFKPGRIGTVLR